MKIHILGSGTSTGVPVIGCDCRVCCSDDPRDKRTRAAIALEQDGQFLLVDTPPELRLQLLKAGITSVVGIIYTHLHADHTAGFDDLRAFSFKSKDQIPVYMLGGYIDEFEKRFAYAFNPGGYKGAVPQLKLYPVSDQPFSVGPFEIEPMTLPHGSVESLGIKVANFAYVTDFKFVPKKYVNKLKGRIDSMVASGIYFGEHSSHSTINETVQLFTDVGVRRGYISHISHLVSHREDTAKLPGNVEFTFDGMLIDL